MPGSYTLILMILIKKLGLHVDWLEYPWITQFIRNLHFQRTPIIQRTSVSKIVRWKMTWKDRIQVKPKKWVKYICCFIFDIKQGVSCTKPKQKLPNNPKWYLDAQPRVLFPSSMMIHSFYRETPKWLGGQMPILHIKTERRFNLLFGGKNNTAIFKVFYFIKGLLTTVLLTVE